MGSSFDRLPGLLAQLRQTVAELSPQDDPLRAVLPHLMHWLPVDGLAVLAADGSASAGTTAGPTDGTQGSLVLHAVGSLAGMASGPVTQAGIPPDVVIPVDGEALQGVVLPPDSSAEVRDLVRVLGLALDYELQGLAAERTLQERVKELRVLRDVQLATQECPSRPELLQRTVDAVPRGLARTDIARAEIRASGILVTAGAEGTFQDHVSVELRGDGVAGRLIVGYVDDSVALLPEEHQLANAIAETLTAHLERVTAQAALTASERRRQQVLEALPMTVFSVRSDRWVEILAFDDQLPVGRPAGIVGRQFDLGSWEEPPARTLRGLVDRAFGGEHLREEFAWRDGTWDVWLEPVPGPTGSIDEVFGLVADATASKRSRQLQARLAALVDSASLGIVGMDIDGVITSWNQGAAELFGWTTEQAVGQDIGLIDTQDPDGIPIRQLSASGPQLRFSDPYIETTRRSRDGREIPVGVSLASIRDADDRAVGISATYQDLSAQVRATNALAASEEQFRLIADKAQDVIYRLNVRDKPTIEYLNPAAESVLGFSREELMRSRRLLVERTHPDDREPAIGSISRPEGAGGTFVSRWQRKDGRWIVLEDRRTVLEENGRPAMIVGIARDITDQQEAVERTREELVQERRIAEELRELDEMKTAFLSAVSHELRTPLTSVLGFAETARRQARTGDPELAHYLERLLVNARRLQALMDDLLDVDRLSRGEVAPRRREVDLADLVRRSLRGQESPDHAFFFDLRPTVLPLDRVMMDRVIDNLGRNAGRHTPPGTSVWVSVRPTPEGARLVVEDDGPGVPPDERDRVFEPFQQGETASLQPSPGTGIGLALVRRFVEAHGGTVTLDERPGGGARFAIDLPRAQAT